MTGRPESSSEVLAGWGMAHHASSRVYRPTSPEAVAEALADAAERGLTVSVRGGGLSYADAALNDRGATLLLDGLDGPVEVDAEAGTVTAPASATIRALWHAVLPHGFWLPVVPGAMGVTLGGAIAANIHGKNHLRRGSFGEHLRDLEVVDATGAIRRLEGTSASEWAGSLGLSGVATRATVALKPIRSGLLDVIAEATATLEASMERLEEGAERHEYAVAWLDAFGGSRAGRGILHFADDLPADHPRVGACMTPEAQRLPPRIMGVIPRSVTWRVLKLFGHDPGMRLLNVGRYLAGRARDGARYLQTHAAFHFLLDYVPNWKRVYSPHGLLQVQLFLPSDRALAGFRRAFELQAEHGVPSWLAVLKRHGPTHRPHDYWREGFSLALDLPVRPRRAEALARLLEDLERLRLEEGGGLYAAKDGAGRGLLPPGGDPAFDSDLARRWSTKSADPGG